MQSIPLHLTSLAALSLLQACSSPAPPAASIEIRSAAGSRTLSGAGLAALSTHELSADGATYRGALLRDVLAPDAPSDVVARGTDGYTQTIAAGAAYGDGALVAYEKDGAPLAPPEGPVRLVVRGSPGLSVRTLASLELVGPK